MRPGCIAGLAPMPPDPDRMPPLGCRSVSDSAPNIRPASHCGGGRHQTGPRNFLYVLSMVFVCLFVCFCLFRVAPTAYGSSQVRGRIRATAASLHHSYSNTGSKPRLRPTPQLMATLIHNPLSEARDRTRNLMATSWVCNPLSHIRSSSTCLKFTTALGGKNSDPHVINSEYKTQRRVSFKITGW